MTEVHDVASGPDPGSTGKTGPSGAGGGGSVAGAAAVSGLVLFFVLTVWLAWITGLLLAVMVALLVRQAPGVHRKPWRSVGAAVAAGFLRRFVDADTDWAHLDIAGPAFNDKGAHGYTASGGTGVGVRTLVELARSMQG